jgi:hypothetical protein
VHAGMIALRSSSARRNQAPFDAVAMDERKEIIWPTITVLRTRKRNRESALKGRFISTRAIWPAKRSVPSRARLTKNATVRSAKSQPTTTRPSEAAHPRRTRWREHEPRQEPPADWSDVNTTNPVPETPIAESPPLVVDRTAPAERIKPVPSPRQKAVRNFGHTLFARWRGDPVSQTSLKRGLAL